ncbi:MAG: hypothetical protein KDA79_12670, partial [Planctomycetaceae bacterium]|nr:hypothetical protein [Planctomycetaceae bacterium]
FGEMTAWLKEHEEIRQELFTAIKPEHDDVGAVLALFNQLRKEFPKQIEKYAHLAIATSVVWDGRGRGVYDYEHHQRRTHSYLPENMLEAIDNFRYFLDTENVMQGRAQFLPWEFLVFLIDHRTPLAERQWALNGYGNRRSMFGRCYQDVPYDTEMLETSSRVCRLDGKDYSLPNILSFGGVCAMQADFAARVGKSIGVPSAYVGGESRSGDLHAWVMWVELLDVKPGRIRFSLESHGRYRGDRYYVGTLYDPQTGIRITDRELERRLQASGVNAVACRHADLLMRAWPLLRDEGSLNVTQQLQLLWDVISISPGNAEPWAELAKISSSEELNRDQRRMMVRSLDKLFVTFAGFPDFTWTVFDDLIRYEKELKVRNQLYERLIGLYDAASRPDLASTARLKLADYQVEEGKPEAAIAGLAGTILRYVDEGRYVPLMLDRLEAIHREQKGNDAEIVAFYQQFLPKIPRKRGDSPSKYCQQMYRRAIALFDKAGRDDLAATLRVELDKLQSSSSR